MFNCVRFHNKFPNRGLNPVAERKTRPCAFGRGLIWQPRAGAAKLTGLVTYLWTLLLDKIALIIAQVR